MAAAPVVLALNNTITPAVALEILPQGLAVNRIYLNADGETHDIVEGPFDTTQHQTPPFKYLNTVVGRYANRIPTKENGHSIEKDGISATIKPVYNERGKVSLHGGPNALDTVLFETLKAADSALFSAAELQDLKTTDYSNVLFTTTIPDGSNGFPGTLRIEVLFAVIEPTTTPAVSPGKYADLGSALIVYRARLTDSAKITPINLTQHWGFNLESSLRPTPNLNVRDHYLTLKSPAIVAIDEHLLPTGQLEATEGTSHEHNGKKIGDRFPDKGYDHFYLFPKDQHGAANASQPGRVPVAQVSSTNLLKELLETKAPVDPPVELWSEKTGYKVQFSTNQGGVQLYTANFQNSAGTRKKIHGGVQGGDGYPKEGAVFLEFHDPPSAFLYPQNGIDTLLTSEELYHNYVKLNFAYKSPARASA